MNKSSAFFVALFAVSSLFAARHVDFETDACSKAVSEKVNKSFVFSPASFEIDSAIIAESLATIPKANVSEMMGVTIDFPSTYRPILEAYSESPTNGIKVLSARGFCVSDLKNASANDRHYLDETYGVAVLDSKPPQGAEAWLRATMEGEMDDFELPAQVVHSDRYAFYDLISITAAFKDPFPTANSRKVKGVDCISDVRQADTWETSTFTALRLPLKDDAYFYALLPKGETELKTLKTKISSASIDNLLTIMDSVTEPGVAHGPCAIVLPKLSIVSRVNLLPVFAHFKVPTKGLVHVAGEVSAKECTQLCRFTLAENGATDKPLVEKAEKDVIPLGPTVKRLFFTKPFIYFVYHKPTATIPVFGQYVP